MGRLAFKGSLAVALLLVIVPAACSLRSNKRHVISVRIENGAARINPAQKAVLVEPGQRVAWRVAPPSDRDHKITAIRVLNGAEKSETKSMTELRSMASSGSVESADPQTTTDTTGTRPAVLSVEPCPQTCFRRTSLGECIAIPDCLDVIEYEVEVDYQIISDPGIVLGCTQTNCDILRKLVAKFNQQVKGCAQSACDMPRLVGDFKSEVKGVISRPR